MIEMRWLTRDSKLDISEDHIPCYAKERVLQYRQKIDVTIRAGMWDNKGIAETANMQWSEWRDVPLVAERDMQCP